ncbi:hydantoinase B/oxoprolinase family protein [Pseudonocardia kujensis]|uniref:hydantoinase B/oxoprolinase family protein n=1 Tax=Pseudonocardia kujensis TaxID=1128675 RepID=UPI001E5CDE26|nr:hydantoinase B/oxoprolinase family protein [Pseudonocardia kujensis]MCE0761908.1 hydantoinase B/oxoprolinase family protein [Pseudonocardia kujensis]
MTDTSVESNAPTVPLKDLDDAQFQELYGTDRFTATVLSSRVRYIVDHMCTGLLNNAFSQILRDWYDFAATISGPPAQNYPMSAVSNSLALFLGTMCDAVRNTVEEYGSENLRPGDVLICNDPYRSGTHVNDILFIRPVFVDGEIISFVSLRAHQLDMGGVVPGGFSGTKRNVYENGLVIAPNLLYRDDRPLAPTFNLIFDNARLAALLLPDIKTIYQNLLLGERLVIESVERYGVQAYLGALRYSTDVSADAMREGLLGLPDGVYLGEDGIDADGVDDSIEYRIRVRITKVGGRVEIDLSGTSPQARSSVNGTMLDAKTAVGIAFKYLIDRHTPFTSGTYRDIDIVIPPGTVVSATPPDGAVFIYWETSEPLLHAVFRALRDALGEEAVGGSFASLNLHNAHGLTDDGTPWLTACQTGGEHGPWGATRHGDADSYTVFYTANNLDPATEAIEADIPGVILRKEYAPDTAGAGTNRGGAAVRKDTLWLTAAEHFTSPLHVRAPSGIGVHGGADGAAGACWIFPPETFDVREQKRMLGTNTEVYAGSVPVTGVLDPQTKALDPAGEYFYFASTPNWQTSPGTVFRYLTNGGGGWGDPLRRDPERVKRDVRDEYVTIEGAYRDYGVVITGDPRFAPEQLVVDLEATHARRRELLARRG